MAKQNQKRMENLSMNKPLGLTDETGAELRMGDFISVMSKNGIGRTNYRIVAVTESGRAAVAIGEGFSSIQIPIDDSMRKRIRQLPAAADFFDVYT